MGFRVLSSFGEDREIWAHLVNNLKTEDRDIHFLPDYGEIYKKTYGYEPYLAMYGNEKRYVIQPFVERCLNDLPFLKENRSAEKYTDIANAYGYGGPVCLGDSLVECESLFHAFDALFKEYCFDKKIASEFVSLHPLLNNKRYIPEDSTLQLLRQKDVVFLDLSLSKDEIWRGFNKGHKSSVSKAQKKGVRIEKMEPSGENLDVFQKLYYLTMQRKQAAERWYFPRVYFSNCFHCLGSDRASLFFAYVNDRPVSAYVLLHAFSTAYYHFGGSDEQYSDYQANSLLVYATALWAKGKGFATYHLGGGVTSDIDDNLFRFKSGFSKHAVPLYTYQRIHNDETYDYLCKLKMHYEASLNEESQSDYFPLYRR